MGRRGWLASEGEVRLSTSWGVERQAVVNARNEDERPAGIIVIDEIDQEV